MAEPRQHRGVITFVKEGKGWFFAEDIEDHRVVLVHMGRSADNRYLHVGDVIAFTPLENQRRPGKFIADKFSYVGHSENWLRTGRGAL